MVNSPMLAQIVAALALVIWLYLLFGRGGFWLSGERDDGEVLPPQAWPRIMAVIPARDEAECIGESIASLVSQDYPGDLGIIVVDDGSSDDTAAIAERTAAAAGAGAKFEVVAG